LIKIVDRIIEALAQTNQYSLEQVKKEFTAHRLSNLQQSKMIMDSITTKINQGSERREKGPNYILVKYMFNFYVFDILLFLILRHHREINDQIANSAQNLIDYDKLENTYYTPIKGFKVIMQKLVYDLRSYDGASAPYVSHVLDLLVKFSIGEEFHLASEILEELEMHSSMIIKKNDLKEYRKIRQKFKKT
jgi:hypothetical protein